MRVIHVLVLVTVFLASSRSQKPPRNSNNNNNNDDNNNEGRGGGGSVFTNAEPSTEEQNSPMETNDDELVTSMTIDSSLLNGNERTVRLAINVDDTDASPGQVQEGEGAEEKSDDDFTELLQYAAPTSVKVCPGVCVAQRISNFCEAAIDVEGLCKTELRCCVPANLFNGVDNVPKEFLILNPSDGSQTRDESRSEMTDPPKSSTTSTTTSTATTTTSTTTQKTEKPTTKVTTTTTTTTERNIPESSTSKHEFDVPSGFPEEASMNDQNSGIPPERRCKGTCVAGFFAFLCDAIDRSGECPRGGRCCVTQKRPKTKPRPGAGPDKNNENDRPNRYNKTPKTTVPPPRKRDRTTTTTTPAPPRRTTTEEAEPLPPPCSGTCLPVSVASRCQSPSRLVMSIGCRDDEICCDDRGREPERLARPGRPRPRPGSSMPSLGSFLSLFGGGGAQKDNAPSRRTTTPAPTPPPTPPPTTTTTTPPTTTEAIVIPDCPGTCISPILSFTCFGNAEMTELFKCTKEKQSCCAPKSAIRDWNRQNEIRNIARNDTVFTPPFVPYGPYGHPPFNNAGFEQGHYAQNPYEQPNYIHQNYPQPQEETNYQPSFYSGHGLQPPPPPPPHLQIPPHLQQPTFKHPQHHFQDPTAFETPTNERPYQPYRQHVPESQQPTAVQQPHYPYSNEANAPFYQVGPTYKQQNETIRYTHPAEVITTPLPPVTTVAIEESSQVSNKFVCGVKGTNRAGRVVGGEDSVPGEWCWQVALINSLNQYLCGGALIGTQWVLTAAHCVTNIVRSGDAIYVRVGDHDLTTRFGSPGAQTIPVATTYIHHNHNSQTLDNDIALLKLSSHAELGNGVCLVCLPARGVSQVAGKRCTVTGYGYMGETGPIPLRVREAEIPVVSDNECVRKINAVTEKIFILPASSFCSGGESGHDACQGDGGGPLVCNVDDYFELSGLVSWGFGCGRQDVPGVYVKVSSFIGWVNQIISVNNS